MAGRQEGGVPRRVAVVGCGVSGLTAVKALLEEGLQPHCFEMDSDIGGLWRASETPKTDGRPQMYDSLVTNISKAMMCFSDFPCPSHYPPFMPHRLYMEYLHSYAQHFNLRPHITFNTKVLEVKPAKDYAMSGRWEVTTCAAGGNSDAEGRRVTEFDGVILCQGFYGVPYTPRVPGMDAEFEGRIQHASNYKNAKPFRDKTVVVVGSAHTAADVACDLAPVAKQVYLSVRHGAYTISRLVNGRTPLDFQISRAVIRYVPARLRLRVVAKRAAHWLDPVTSGLQPKPSVPLSRVSIIINDQLPFKIMTGQVKVVGHIEKLTSGAEVHLEDGTVLKDVDDIIFATGYTHDFSVIDPAVISSDPKGERLELYHMMFPLSLPHDSLALIGCLRANGPIAPISEIQARLAARVMAGKHQLPDRASRKRDVDRVNQAQISTFGYTKYAFQYVSITDTTAAELGVRPDFLRLLLRGDVQMALRVMFGSAHPFHYRLLGPHAWAGARQATLAAYSDTVLSTQHRTVGGSKGKAERKGSRVSMVACPVARLAADQGPVVGETGVGSAMLLWLLIRALWAGRLG